MARPAMSRDRQHAQAVQAGRRMIAQGLRPTYRLQRAQDGSWAVDALPGLSVVSRDRRAAMDMMRTAISETLDVAPDAFDVLG